MPLNSLEDILITMRSISAVRRQLYMQLCSKSNNELVQQYSFSKTEHTKLLLQWLSASYTTNDKIKLSAQLKLVEMKLTVLHKIARSRNITLDTAKEQIVREIKYKGHTDTFTSSTKR